MGGGCRLVQSACQHFTYPVQAESDSSCVNAAVRRSPCMILLPFPLFLSSPFRKSPQPELIRCLGQFSPSEIDNTLQSTSIKNRLHPDFAIHLQLRLPLAAALSQQSLEVSTLFRRSYSAVPDCEAHTRLLRMETGR